MAGCCAWRRRRRQYHQTIGGESSSDERVEFVHTPSNQQVPAESERYVGTLLKQPRLLVDESKYFLLRSADVDDDEYGNWNAETLETLQSGASVATWLHTPIRKGVPDEFKRLAILRASNPSGVLYQQTDEFVRLLEQRVFGEKVPESLNDELPNFTYGFLGPEQELHQKAKDLDIVVDLGRYTDPRGSLPSAAIPTLTALQQQSDFARLGSFSLRPCAVGSTPRELEYTKARLSNITSSDHLTHIDTSFVGELPLNVAKGTGGIQPSLLRLQRSASFGEHYNNGHQRISRTDSDSQLLEQIPQEMLPNPSLRSLMSSAHTYNSSQTRFHRSTMALVSSGSKLKESNAQSGDLEAGFTNGKVANGASDQLSANPSCHGSHELERLVTTLKASALARPEADGHTLTETTIYATILTDEGRHVASKIIWLINGYYPQVEFAPLLTPLICILLYYVEEREALATVMYVLERSTELLRNQAPRAFMTLRRSEFVRLVKQAVAISEKHLGRLCNHLRDLGVDLAAWIARGLQDGFSHIAPFDLLVRMHIAFLYDGVKAFLRYGLAMLLTAEERLLQSCSADEANHVLLFRELRSCEPAHLNELTKLAYSLKIKYTKQPLAQYLATGEPPTPYLQKTQEPPRYYRPRIYDKSGIMTDTTWIKVWRYLPDYRRILDPYLRFTTSRDGCSVNAMIRALWNYSDLGMIAVILTSDKEVIVIYSPVTFRADFRSVMDTLDPSEAFIGTFGSQTENQQQLKVYYNPGSGKRLMIVNNERVIFGDPQILSIDQELHRGQSVASEHCPIIVNNKFGDFSITIMEIWILE